MPHFGHDQLHDTFSIEVEAKDVLHVINLPRSLRVFRYDGKDKQEFPYLKFYNEVANELGWAITEIDVSNVFLLEDDYKKISQYTYEWLHSTCPYFKHMGVRKQESVFGMESLMYSANVIKNPPAGMIARKGIVPVLIRAPGKRII